MGNSVRKTRMVRVLPEPNAELLPMDSRILEELGHGRGRRCFRPKYRDIINTMHILTALIGNFNSPYRKLGRAGLLLWLLSMSINFMYDGYESRVKYGYPWMSVRGLLWITCCLGTWFTIRRTMPWFEQNLCKLENDKLYRRVLQDMSGTTEVRDCPPVFLAYFPVCRVQLSYLYFKLHWKYLLKEYFSPSPDPLPPRLGRVATRVALPRTAIKEILLLIPFVHFDWSLNYLQVEWYFPL